jgi:serine phosphatase RsbU (regulator of sigma subunit)
MLSSASEDSRSQSSGLASPGPPAPSLVFGSALFATLPGRLFLLTSATLGVLLLLRAVTELPPFFDVLRRVMWVGWFIGAGWLLALTVSRNRRAFLWRVRRKLLLSYVFLGVVPVVLVLAFTLAAALLLYMTVASYVFQDAMRDAVDEMQQIAATSAIEVGRTPAEAALALERRIQSLAIARPALSLAVVPLTAVGPRGTDVVAAGPWAHAEVPRSGPVWLAPGRTFAGAMMMRAGEPGSTAALVIRAAVPTASRSSLVVADLPVDERFLSALRDRTGTTIGGMAPERCGDHGPTAAPAAPDPDSWTLFQQTVAFLDCARWDAETPGRVSITLVAPVGGLYNRLAALNAAQSSSPLGDWAVLGTVLLLLGGLFLIIQGSALVMGGLLARSITWAVHELFEGTERVQQGDFAHRIRIESRDQLGDLATSFNRMSASIEHLLHVQREKQRLDDELRIAREIQKSLLPTRPPRMAGIDIADLCEPAREVGGDYYDFFEVGPRQLGILIADVSGKGISAALYMAELKGLMLALSHTTPSPRRLLIDVNKRLSAHLDNRSFITMTYVVIDLERRTLTAARAGHTPLIVVSGGHGELVTPDGMVLGLRLPGASERFESILVEHSQPLADGDVIVLYTDGITEATDTAGEMFGDAGLFGVLTSHHTLGAAAIRERVLRDVRAFVGEAEPHDDMTMVVLKIGQVA